ncbi:hypothetical protein XENTR_v10024738 [Xenopus tropicalis]|nr:hypothetical protein XENTR_v10024738 [Xenopus tropicalis]
MRKKVLPSEKSAAMATRARLGSSRRAVSQKAAVGAEKKMAATAKKVSGKGKVLPKMKKKKEEEEEQVSMEYEEEEGRLDEAPESSSSGFLVSEPPEQLVAGPQLTASGTSAMAGESQLTCVPESTPLGVSGSPIAMEGGSPVASADWSPWSGMCISQGAEGSGVGLGEATGSCIIMQAAAAMDSDPQLREKTGTSCTTVMEAGHVLGKQGAILETETSQSTVKGKLRLPSETCRKSSKDGEWTLPGTSQTEEQRSPPQLAPTATAPAAGNELSMDYGSLAETVALQGLEQDCTDTLMESQRLETING